MKQTGVNRMIKEKQDNREFMKNAGRRDRILAELKRNGFRITNQRKLLVDIILSDECSCCKELPPYTAW